MLVLLGQVDLFLGEGGESQLASRVSVGVCVCVLIWSRDGVGWGI